MASLKNLSLYKKITIIFIAIITVLLANGLRYAQFDSQMRATSVEKFSNDRAIIIIHDKSLFSPKKLKLISQLKKQIAQLNRVTSIQSLYNTPDIYNYFNHNPTQQQQNEPSYLLEDKPYNQKSAQQAAKNALANKLVIHRFISPQADTIAIYVNIKSTRYSAKSLDTRKNLQALLDQYNSNFAEIYQVSLLDFRQELNDSALHDTKVIMPTIIIVTLVIFSFLFKSILSALCPLVIFTFTSIWTVGAISYLGIPLNIMVTIVLVYVYSISIVESAFFLNAFDKERENVIDKKNFHSLLQKTYKFTLAPALLATSTTILGFAFNSFSSADTIKNFAITISIAIFISIIICIVLMPLFLERLYLSKSHIKTPCFDKASQGVIRLNCFLSSHRKMIFTILISFFALSIYAATQTKINALPYAFVNNNNNSPFYQKVLLTQKYLTGVDFYTVKITAKQKNYFFQSKNLKSLLLLEQEIKKIKNTSTTISFANVIARTFQAYLDGEKEFNKIPERQSTIDIFRTELLKQKTLQQFISPNGETASITVNFAIHNSQELKNYQKKLTELLNQSTKNNQLLHYELIGFAFDYNQTLTDLIKLQFVSLAAIFLLTLTVLIRLLKNYRIIFVALIPNIIPIGTMFITLWLFNYPINAMNIIVFATITGLSVDDTIHIIHGYKEHFLLSNNRDTALTSALNMQIRPVTITSIALFVGIFTLQLSNLDIVKQTGIIFLAGITTAWIADILITPLLLRTIDITKNLTKKPQY